MLMCMRLKALQMNSIIGFLLFFLGIITGATIVFLVVCPIVNYMFNYVQDMKEFLKDRENKTNGEN